MALGKAMILVLRVGARRLAERHVEEDAADTGDVAVDAVEDLAALFVAVEAGADVMTQIAAGLREADGERMGDRTARHLRRLGIVLQVAHEIAGGGEAQPLDFRILRLVMEFVKKTWLG